MLAWIFGALVAWSAISVPVLNSPLIDLSNVISADQKVLIESELRSFSQTGKAQIQVLIIPTLDGEAIEDFSMRAVEQWKVGDQKKDNGVLILVVTQDRKSRIEVGGGIEGELTDIQSKRILADQARPYFQRNDFESGVKVAAAAVMDQLNGLAPSGPSQGPAKQGLFQGKGGLLLFILLFIVFPLLSRRRMGSRRGYGAGALGGFIGGGGFGGSGGGWGSGGGGGGWSGGGGGFSGGGSSDSW